MHFRFPTSDSVVAMNQQKRITCGCDDDARRVRAPGLVESCRVLGVPQAM